MMIISGKVGVVSGAKTANISWLLWTLSNLYVEIGPCDMPSTITFEIWYPEYGVIVYMKEDPGYANWSPEGLILPPGPAEAEIPKSAWIVGVEVGVGEAAAKAWIELMEKEKDVTNEKIRITPKICHGLIYYSDTPSTNLPTQYH